MKKYTPESLQRVREAARKAHTTHGMRFTPEYRSWRSMKQRCLDKADPFYHRYGGRGINIHQPWISSFEAFYAYVGPRPAGTCLERVDSNGDYVPGNVCWADQKTQQRNRSTNRLLTHDGKTLPLIVWAEQLRINPNTIQTRLGKLGWSIEKALTEPVR